MVVRIEAVATTETITEQEFRRMAAWPGVAVRNPGYVFDVGDSEYVATKMDDKRDIPENHHPQGQGIRLPAMVQPRRPHKNDVHRLGLFKRL